LNADDRDAIPYLKLFTFLPQERIEELAAAVIEQPEAREAQRVLAREMTGLVHGPTALERAEQATQALFGGDITGLSGDDVQDIFAEVPSSEMTRSSLEGEGMGVVDLLANSGFVKSKGEARRAIQEGGISLNNRRVSDPAQPVTTSDLLDGHFIVLRRGKKNYHLVKIIG